MNIGLITCKIMNSSLVFIAVDYLVCSCRSWRKLIMKSFTVDRQNIYDSCAIPDVSRQLMSKQAIHG